MVQSGLFICYSICSGLIFSIISKALFQKMHKYQYSGCIQEGQPFRKRKIFSKMMKVRPIKVYSCAKKEDMRNLQLVPCPFMVLKSLIVYFSPSTINEESRYLLPHYCNLGAAPYLGVLPATPGVTLSHPPPPHGWGDSLGPRTLAPPHSDSGGRIGPHEHRPHRPPTVNRQLENTKKSKTTKKQQQI